MTDHRVVAIEKDSWLKVDDPGAPGVIASYLCPKCHLAHQILAPAQSIDEHGTVTPPVAVSCGFSGAVHFLDWVP